MVLKKKKKKSSPNIWSKIQREASSSVDANRLNEIKVETKLKWECLLTILLDNWRHPWLLRTRRRRRRRQVRSFPQNVDQWWRLPLTHCVHIPELDRTENLHPSGGWTIRRGDQRRWKGWASVDNGAALDCCRRAKWQWDLTHPIWACRIVGWIMRGRLDFM